MTPEYKEEDHKAVALQGHTISGGRRKWWKRHTSKTDHGVLKVWIHILSTTKQFFMRLWFITSWIKDRMTWSLFTLLANWAETAKGGKQRGQFLQNSCLPSPWARPKEPGERTPYYILVSERVCFTNCDWKTLYQNVNGGDSRRNEDLKKKLSLSKYSF